MDTGWTKDLLDWIAVNPGWAAFWIFVMAFVESLAFVGILVPGIIILFGIGTLISFGGIELWPVWVLGSVGALAGDVISYAVGHRYRSRLIDVWPFSRFPGMIERGREYFYSHGAKSVAIGRFIGPLRPVIPITAGMMGMSPKKFLMVAIPSCILWTPAYLLPGMLFGASLEVASEYAGRMVFVLAIIFGVLWLTFWVIFTVYELLASRSARWLRHFIRWLRRHPVFRRVAGPLLDSRQPEVLSIMMMGVLLLGFFWAVIMLLLLSPFSESPQSVDQAVQSYALALRNHIADPIMVALSQLSRLWVLIPTSFAVLLWLLGADRKLAAMHWLVAMGGAVVLQIILSWGLRSNPLISEIGSFINYDPSQALTLATVILGYFAVMVARELKRKRRKWPYISAGLLLVLLMLARLYLGLDWFSGALLGVALGMVWTFVVGIAYRQRVKNGFSGLVASLIFFSVLAITFAAQVNLNIDRDLNALKVPLSQREISEVAWWDDVWQTLPRERTSLGSTHARDFNFQFAGDPDSLTKLLAGHGWEVSEPANWRWLILAMNPDATNKTLPPLKKDYLGHADNLLLHRIGDNPVMQETLRLWDSGVRLKPSGQALYLGQISNEKLVQRFHSYSYWSATSINDKHVAYLAEDAKGWDTRWADPSMLLIRQ
jgi:undecaprenyl-diphosphatase